MRFVGTFLLCFLLSGNLFAQRLIGGGNIPLPTDGSQVCSLMAQAGTPCSDAYSMTRQLVQGYTGPLFTVRNNSVPSITCDVTQNPNGTANYSSCIASACVGAVASGCNVLRIYDQVNTANNLQLWGGAFTLQIDATTNLPWLDAPTAGSSNAEWFITSNPGAADLTSDLPAVGAPATGAARSVAYVGRPNQTTTCCGDFGWAHKASLALGAPGYYGGDMMIDTQFGFNSSYGTGTAGFYSLNLDAEQGSGCAGTPTVNAPGIAAISTTIFDALFISTWDGSTTMTNGYNGHAGVGNLSGCTLQGQYVHLQGGGDMTYAPITFREGILTSGAMSLAAQAAYLNNVKAFYSQLTFN